MNTNTTVLYPVTNETRLSFCLNDMWHFRFDPESNGESLGWMNHLDSDLSLPVPASFQDFFTNPKDRNYCGDFWYEYDFFLPVLKEGDRALLRFGSISHRCVLYVNGVKITEHEGGFLPVIADITDAAHHGAMNHIAVKANNELNESSLPCGAVKHNADGTKSAKPYFDFYNYAGIQRNVWLSIVPKEGILDFDTDYCLEGNDAYVSYKVHHNADAEVSVVL
ncbi:MAG: hypothetical protein IKE16_07725 [Solobacterium sp.]|nr:hypothetical protein [Solobacterium sp.]